MKILITGSSGFIGSHAVTHFQSAGFETAVAGRSGPASDSHPEGAIREALSGIDVVFHAAGIAHARGIPVSLIERVNVQWPARIAAACSKADVPFVFLSSSKVYGETGHFTEASPLCPADNYACAKRDAESAILKTGARVVILRPPPVYGPGSKGSFRALLKAVKRGIPLPVAAVRAKRSYVHVANLLSAAEHLIRSSATGTFNVSDGGDIALSDLVKLMASAAGVPDRSFAVPEKLLRAALFLRPGLYDKIAGEFTLAIDALKKTGWNPGTTMDAGVRDALLS